tara:strand:+ start:575 stop:1060 length:486 start_codon:yes stop_codon:yes gene_type:complete
MKNDMNLIMESWRQQTLLEGMADLIKNKNLDKETVEKVDNKLSDNEGYQLAKQLFSIINQEDTDKSNDLDEGPLDWMQDKVRQAYVDGMILTDMLKKDPAFAPILKLSPAMLALAYAYIGMETGVPESQIAATAAEIVIKKGKLDVNSLADMVNEQRKIDG